MTRDTAGNALEILFVFALGTGIVWIGWRWQGDDAFARQIVVWVANVAMLGAIWVGLRLRGRGWKDLGLEARSWSGRAILVGGLKAVAVLAAALAAFVAGSLLASGLPPAAATADLSGYEYLRGDLPMLLLSLTGVYVVSSFGEEVIYRGFLMTRIAEWGDRSSAAWAGAVPVSAVVFGLAHFGWGLAGIVQTTCMGLALGVAYLLVHRNLWVLIGAHAVLDTALLVPLYFGS